MNRTPPTLTSVHGCVYDDLPWYVAGVLDESLGEKIRAHLEECEICRTAYEHEVRIANHLRSDDVIDLAPQASLARLMGRIDNHEARRRRLARVRSWFTTHPRRFLIATAAIQAVVIAALVGILMTIMPETQEAAEYRTLSRERSAPPIDKPMLRAVFADDLTAGELRGLLNEVGADIIDGPGSNGVFTLTLASGSDADAAVHWLRDRPGVRFAEIVFSAAPPP